MNEQLYQKIDGRHTGVGEWAYFTKLPPSWKSGRYAINQIFYKHYAWCWETWGPSKIIHDWYTDIDRGVLKKMLLLTMSIGYMKCVKTVIESSYVPITNFHYFY